MEYNDRLRNIDDFFKELSVEEFERKLEVAGILDIEPSSNDDMEFSLSLRYVIDRNRNMVYISEKNEIDIEPNNSYIPSENFIKAV